MLLENRVALVTGASRGIGRAIAELFAQHGAQLVLNAREDSNLQAVAQRVRELSGRDPICVGYDVGDRVKVKEVFGRIQRECGRLDILVNNAGVFENALLGMISPAQIESTLSTNVKAPIEHLQLAARLMRKAGGSIINLSSIIGRNGYEGQVLYAASKAAVIGATLSAAKELAPLKIRVNAIAPGLIGTDMVESIKPAQKENLQTRIGLGRLGTPEDVAKVALFLASDLSGYVTGQVIGVDGGMVV
jgi:3-oxoacyl-[acyl-carrier protein] reductase